ncbi:TetR family transcriptional regulator [Corynebacterium sp. YIM 101645]|uniref:TetR family transcriptional regulator n=1 Tax=Corynebacterium lemuris TaxID=1859292 RepID=A0ABT2FYA4_9CORY|nr:TetR/AcrR family transcriptional regulator [Corynebacterium lemuris]MCS5480225.1 TetR family transcriptional regulator [Corynebacterium lemuris]
MYDVDPTGLDDTSTVDGVIEVALEQFSEHGFPETRLDNIAKISGMSKRMIHYHFGDKRGLYHRCLVAAVERITPAGEEMTLDTTVPVEGVTRLVEAVYSRLIENPDCVRLLAMESLHKVMNLRELAHLHNQSEISLHLDRLLLIGQDAGAFRPGIAAEDLFYLMGSLAFFRLTNQDLMINLFDLDPASAENTGGVRRLMIDAVVSFLTANIRDSGHDSYLVTDMVGDGEPQSALGIYDAEDLD